MKLPDGLGRGLLVSHRPSSRNIETFDERESCSTVEKYFRVWEIGGGSIFVRVTRLISGTDILSEAAH